LQEVDRAKARLARFTTCYSKPDGSDRRRRSNKGNADRDPVEDVLLYFGGEMIEEGSFGSTLSWNYASADRVALYATGSGDDADDR